MKILIGGCGWLGTALGRRLAAEGHEVIGIRRDPAHEPALRGAGIEPLTLDLNDDGDRGRLPDDADVVVSAVSAGGRSIEAYRAAYLEATGALLDAAARGGVRRFVYVGSTGVFGQTDGSEVDEETPPLPSSPTARILVEAEERVLGAGSAAERPGRVVRLSGLYGPGRYGVLERVRSGRLALGPGEDAWMNWCHLEDAVRAVRAAARVDTSRRVFHASDAHPPRRRDFVTWVAGRLGIDPLTVEDGGLGPPSLPRANRRIRAERSRRELGIELAYPSFREGLEPAFDAESAK
jgi:nucleoside-diphosphate-sugar epimerase